MPNSSAFAATNSTGNSPAVTVPESKLTNSKPGKGGRSKFAIPNTPDKLMEGLRSGLLLRMAVAREGNHVDAVYTPDLVAVGDPTPHGRCHLHLAEKLWLTSSKSVLQFDWMKLPGIDSKASGYMYHYSKGADYRKFIVDMPEVSVRKRNGLRPGISHSDVQPLKVVRVAWIDHPPMSMLITEVDRPIGRSGRPILTGDILCRGLHPDGTQQNFVASQIIEVLATVSL